jgi:PadR family transcriptional regulator PadR
MRVIGSRSPSSQTVRVLGALAADPTVWRYGYELGAEIGLRSGSLYPILARLADRALLDATWETDPRGGRPPRHLYRLTSEGVAYAAAHAPSPAAVASGPRLSLGGAS